MKAPLFYILFFLSFSITGFSQSTQKFIDSGSVNNQFDFLIDKSNRYQEYKVVRITWLNALKSNVNDSLEVKDKDLNLNRILIGNQASQIDSLNTELGKAKSDIGRLDNENQSFSLFGIQFKKSVFRIIFFSIIGGLLLLLVIFISRFKASNRITQQIKSNLKEVEEEFETHRKVALEREQKVRRQLQDELNKQKPE